VAAVELRDLSENIVLKEIFYLWNRIQVCCLLSTAQYMMNGWLWICWYKDKCLLST